ncbi:WapI family immunity protein [Calidifontibacter indicus]|uniref:WapI family immunity protein n=1 Tax=Calidifontibacter indicus TaxID=419650 RepID=UPI003D7600B6
MTVGASPELVIGSAGADHVSITVTGREHPEADDGWDANWVVAVISVVMGSFRGTVRASLRTDEIHRFKRELKSLNTTLAGTAVLDSLERWIAPLTVRAEPGGRFGYAVRSGTEREAATSLRLR